MMHLKRWLAGGAITILLLALPLRALATNAIINCSTTSLGTTYGPGTANNSLGAYAPAHLQGLFVRKPATMQVSNASSTRICLNTVSPTLPTSKNDGNEFCVPASSTVIFPNFNQGQNLINIYLRADVSACTANVVDVSVW